LSDNFSQLNSSLPQNQQIIEPQLPLHLNLNDNSVHLEDIELDNKVQNFLNNFN
jgi:hypothetical protein